MWGMVDNKSELGGTFQPETTPVIHALSEKGFRRWVKVGSVVALPLIGIEALSFQEAAVQFIQGSPLTHRAIESMRWGTSMFLGFGILASGVILVENMIDAVGKLSWRMRTRNS